MYSYLYAQVVVCDDNNISDVYAQNITCNSKKSSAPFALSAYQISTIFDPNIYADEGYNLQLHYTYTYSNLAASKGTKHIKASLANTVNTFKDNFFWGRDSSIIETA